MRKKGIKWLDVIVTMLFVSTEQVRRDFKGTLPCRVKREAI